MPTPGFFFFPRELIYIAYENTGTSGQTQCESKYNQVPPGHLWIKTALQALQKRWVRGETWGIATRIAFRDLKGCLMKGAGYSRELSRESIVSSREGSLEFKDTRHDALHEETDFRENQVPLIDAHLKHVDQLSAPRLILHSTAGPELGKVLYLWCPVYGRLCDPLPPSLLPDTQHGFLYISGIGWVPDLMVKNPSSYSAFHPVWSLTLVRETWLLCLLVVFATASV